MKKVKKFCLNSVVPIGKYKGKTFQEMSKDHSYFDWYLTNVIYLKKYGNDFMYSNKMNKLKWDRRNKKSKEKQENWNIKYGNTINSNYYKKSNHEFPTAWSEDVYGGYNSGELQ